MRTREREIVWRQWVLPLLWPIPTRRDSVSSSSRTIPNGRVPMSERETSNYNKQLKTSITSIDPPHLLTFAECPAKSKRPFPIHFYVTGRTAKAQKCPVKAFWRVPIVGVAFLYPARKNLFEYFSLNTGYRAGPTVECSWLKPNLSNSFLYLLLANDTVRVVVRLGYW